MSYYIKLLFITLVIGTLDEDPIKADTTLLKLLVIRQKITPNSNHITVFIKSNTKKNCENSFRFHSHCCVFRNS